MSLYCLSLHVVSLHLLFSRFCCGRMADRKGCLYTGQWKWSAWSMFWSWVKPFTAAWYVHIIFSILYLQYVESLSPDRSCSKYILWKHITSVYKTLQLLTIWKNPLNLWSLSAEGNKYFYCLSTDEQLWQRPVRSLVDLESASQVCYDIIPALYSSEDPEPG